MRILTGIQPSGKLHWGNYFGAMKSMFDLQEKGENFMFIANFHAMTTVRDGVALRESTRDVALDYLACGLDTTKTIMYRQSDVPEVQELAWYLSCLTPMGLLERIDRLNRNAKGFLEVGKPLQAMKCYETVVLIRPNDPVAIHNFGACLMKIGKRDLAEKILEKAKKLAEQPLDSNN